MAWHPDGKNPPLRSWEKDVQVGVEEWTQAINDKADLACRACYSMGPWMFIYVPNCVETGRSLNPVLVQCPCGAALTFEEGLSLQFLSHQLKACFPGLLDHDDD